jgi:hypothetical protein
VEVRATVFEEAHGLAPGLIFLQPRNGADR